MPVDSFINKFKDIDGESQSTDGRSFFDFDAARRGSTRYTEVEWTLYPGAEQLARVIRQSHPRGVNDVLIGVKKVPGYNLTITSNGIIAVLIGLLLPAVQKAREAASAEQRTFRTMLAPGGTLGFLMGDGSVRPTPMVINMKHVYISSYQSSGSAGG